MKRTPSITVIVVMLAALAVIAVAAVVAWMRIADRGPVAMSGGSGTMAVSPAVAVGGPFQLVDHHNQPVNADDFRGKFLLTYFGYGYCPDVCPTELAVMGQAVDALGAKGERVQPLFITVDPARDTPQFLADYVPHFHPRMIGLTGTPEQIAEVAKAYRVYYAKVESPQATEYVMDHTSFVYLMGPDGASLTMFRYGISPEAMAEAIDAFIDKAA